MRLTRSLASSLASLPEKARLTALEALTLDELKQLEADWRFWARPDQIAPEGDWRTWLALAGRGWGKTEAGAQWVVQRVRDGARSIALVAETQKDLEEVMVPRIVKVSGDNMRPEARFRPVRITWPNGAQALGYNGTEPDQLRGPEFDTAWVDELAKYRYARDVWDMLQFTMRSGSDPRVCVTTTPRPIPLIKELASDPSTAIVRGRTFDNAANLAPQFIEALRERYGGTRLGRQELEAEILDDLPGALWTRAMIEEARIKAAPEMRRIVVAIDPSGTSGNDEGDSIGIVIAGLGIDGRGYLLADRTCHLSPAGWGRRAVEAYHEFTADRIVAERNFGGAMVEHVIRTTDSKVAYREVTASRGKVVRAEPVAALFEQGKVGIVGAMPELEDQLCSMGPDGYVGEGSPDRLDAMVWALTDLMLGKTAAVGRVEVLY